MVLFVLAVNKGLCTTFRTIIKAMPFIVPANDELVEFHAFAAPMFAMIKANQKENVRLTELRDSLLSRLMSGELDVSDIQL